MKVLVWNTNFLRDAGGSQKVTHYLACDLHRLGIQTTIACERTTGQKQNAVFGNLPSEVALYQDTFVNPWEASERSTPQLRQLFVYLAAAVRAFSFIRKERFSLIHLNYVSWDIILLGLCSRLWKIPLVVTFLGGETSLARQKRLTRLKVRVALQLADRVTAVSESLCEEISQEFGFTSVLHVPFFRDPSGLLSSDCVLPSEFVEDQFVFCGRISPEKQVPFLIHSFREATGRGCSKKLYIIGEGKGLPECRQLVRRYKLQKKVIFFGWLPHHIVLHMISKCRCLILCSRTESNPQVILEAMSFERPVICSLLPGVKHIVVHGETGLTFDITRKDLFVEAVLRVSNDEAYARRLGHAAGAHMKTLFPKHSFGEQIAAIYSEVISHRQS